MNRDAKQSPDAAMPGLTVQREAPTVALQARLIGTLEIDTSTNCLVVRTPMGMQPARQPRRHRCGLASRLECRTP